MQVIVWGKGVGVGGGRSTLKQTEKKTRPSLDTHTVVVVERGMGV